ncbi:uncharacterized protein PHACADRAFT_203375 [Phanerochaete carnosa HHB-10118-sp]|uniref:Uncharacterized protein n=1 Tax=Phanerochaete carnosa (strain HHB-10118-sp) TaxID=650164 RepID=K5WCV0_PHACS|nr:uncharacterized protein PHACADRAFT_203375 [Phanerochaete carnosa HHB-10118-sp]EKM48007.1 hypothetical protein PHACADRAFT_203375 [Phanerochaete carnosa HHB-10118-sp]
MFNPAASNSASLPPATAYNLPAPSDEPLEAEYSEDTDETALWSSNDEMIKEMVEACIQDFDAHGDDSKVSLDAAEIARNSITQGTQEGHMRVAKHYITYHKKHNPQWDEKAITPNTPNDIRVYIQEKCGSKSNGYQGCRYATAISIRAALTYWYKHVRKIEDTSEWRVDQATGQCFGLPTRSLIVAKYMIGLEKTKAKAGEIQQSVKAMTVEMMHSLYMVCIGNPKLSAAQ